MIQNLVQNIRRKDFLIAVGPWCSPQKKREYQAELTIPDFPSPFWASKWTESFVAVDFRSGQEQRNFSSNADHI